MARIYEVYFRVEKYFTNESSERVKSFVHEKINFIPSSQHVIFFYYIDMSVSKIKKNLDEKQRNDVSDIFTREDIENVSLVSRI